MENKKQLLLLLVAVVVGLAATWLTSMYVSRSIQEQAELMKEEYDAKQKQTVEAMRQENDQKLAALAQQMQQAKAAQEANFQRQITDMQTKLAAQQKAAAEAPAKKKIKPSLALKTPQGKRAVTILIESLAAVGGLLNPGDLVDVIAQLSVPVPGSTDKKSTVTAMIFQGLEVLAVNTNLQETGVYYDEQQASAAIKVTVAVDPDEAGLLTFADKNGKLELALRSPQETDRQMVKASTWKTLADYVLQNQGAQIDLPDELKGASQKKGEAKPAAKPTIQIFRGGKEL